MMKINRNLIIGFMTTLNRNVGDEFIREGVKSILDALIERYECVYIDKHNSNSIYQSVGDEVSIFPDKYKSCDIFIQSGAPVYWWLFDGNARSTNSEWHEWIWKERVLNRGIKLHPTFWNIGAGSCMEPLDDGASFVGDAECAHFARLAGARAAVTVVRDPIAAKILKDLNVPHTALACPAFFAALRYNRRRSRNGAIGINLMALGGHFEVDTKFSADKWLFEINKLVHLLRKNHKIVFIAHDEAEVNFLNSIKNASELCFFSDNWRDYIEIYSSCEIVIANRVHGAVCAAGFGVPAVILGNDTRAEISRYIGIEMIRSALMEADTLSSIVYDMIDNREEISKKLLITQHKAFNDYIDLLKTTNLFLDDKFISRNELSSTFDYYNPETKDFIIQSQLLELKSTEFSLLENNLINLDFSLHGNLSYLNAIYGLSPAESWGSWTDANLSRTCILVFKSPLPKCFELKIVASYYELNDLSSSKIRIGEFEFELNITSNVAEFLFYINSSEPLFMMPKVLRMQSVQSLELIKVYLLNIFFS